MTPSRTPPAPTRPRSEHPLRPVRPDADRPGRVRPDHPRT
jgi:hypothetical protein